ncbi:transposon Ty3-I Gag-Pol polyprotein [Trichonephila clavipes]|uniref:Transposon Ty3-I Gag-Pol polyprotein n=1 Tax=Trichonephila clavipes TaxID=2585209 RepID=A0A8X6UW62_TRICX|nr:transposon Ty3-I Gag-Pol polyprotein [Trichonephila clavipes]
MLPFCPNDYDDNNITKIAVRAEESLQLVRVHTLRAQDKYRRRYDSKHQMVSYVPGDLVWVYTPVKKVGISKKLLRRYFGPYQVLRRLSPVTYEVQDFDPASRKRKLRDHDPAEQIETEDKEIQDIIPPKEPYKGPTTRSKIKTLEQNDSGALSSYESRSFFRVHTGYFSNIRPRVAQNCGGLVVKVTDSWPTCHEFEPTIVEDSLCRERCKLNMSRLKRPPVAVVRKFELGMPALVTSSPLEHGWKSRDLSPKELLQLNSVTLIFTHCFELRR